MLGRQGQAVGGCLAKCRCSPDDHLLDRNGNLATIGARVFQQLTGQLALVDEQDPAIVHPEGRPEAA